MDIKTKFNLGDIVYYASKDQTTETVTCPVCQGKKVVHIVVVLGQDVPGSRCPQCYGKGFTTKYINGYHPEEARVRRVNTDFTDGRN